VLGHVAPGVMFSALNVPPQKLEKRELDDAQSRITNLRALTGKAPDWDVVKAAMVKGFAAHLGLDAQWGEVSDAEEARAREAFDDEIGTDDFIYEINDPARETGVRTGFHQSPGGAIKAHLRVEGPNNDRIREVLITGDFFVTPPRIIMDLESSLRSAPLCETDARVEAFFKEADVGLLSVAPADFAAAIKAAAA